MAIVLAKVIRRRDETSYNFKFRCAQALEIVKPSADAMAIGRFKQIGRHKLDADNMKWGVAHVCLPHDECLIASYTASENQLLKVGEKTYTFSESDLTNISFLT